MGVGGGLPAEAADEELVLDKVAIGDIVNNVKDVEVADGGVLEDFEELLGGEGFKDLAGIVGSELGGGFEGGDAVLISLELVRGGIYGGERRRKHR